MANFNARLIDDSAFSVVLHDETDMSVEFGNVIKVADFNIYDGEYTITPTDEVQIINTKEKLLTEDVVVQPIPQNYGRISYNGYSLTVS